MVTHVNSTIIFSWVHIIERPYFSVSDQLKIIVTVLVMQECLGTYTA